MERFMERVSLSAYRDNFVIKGGMLVSSLLGVELRSTMDIYTTVKSLSLTEEDAKRIVKEICDMDVADNVQFKITETETIMEDFDYPGVRIHMEAVMDKLKQPIKIDLSTDDVITPGAIEYEYKLMFEERSIRLNTYNTETLLAEKSQTIINRGLANTRMRDFYDMYELVINVDFSWELAQSAFEATCKKRETVFSSEGINGLLKDISNSKDLNAMWDLFKRKNHYVGELDYEVVSKSVCESIRKIART